MVNIKKMTLEQINFSMSIPMKQMKRRENLEKTDFYNVNDISLESRYAGKASDFASIACGYSLKNDFELSKEYFLLAAKHQIKPFEMAYNPNSPNYVGNNIRQGVRDINAIDAFNYSMCANNVELAKISCSHYRYIKTDIQFDMANNYIFALQELINGNGKKAAIYCQESLEGFIKKPSKGINYRSNYYTLHLALFGIITGDQTMFDHGISEQLSICHVEAVKGADAGLVSSRVSDFSIALTNLALLQNLKQNIYDDFIPQGLILENKKLPI